MGYFKIELPKFTNDQKHDNHFFYDRENRTQYHHFFYDLENWTERPECIPYTNTSIQSFKEIGEGYWELDIKDRLINKDDHKLIYGTYYAQKVIWEIQHPPNCSNVKFIYALEHDTGGVGSQIHVLGSILGLALNMGRILIWGPLLVTKWTYGNFCGDDHTWGCYFYPPSNCFPTDDQLKNMQPWSKSLTDDHPVISVPVPGEIYYSYRDILPEVLLPLLHCSPVPVAHFRWWWRVQTSTYLFRPLPKTLQQLEILKKQEFSNKEISNGTIGIHVRHGDKSTEMKLVEFPTYVIAAENLVSTFDQLHKIVFLGTEDPSVIDGAIEINKKGDWKYEWLPENRENKPNQELSAQGDEIVLHVFLGLYYQLLTDAHVGTLLSNWCRLILELKATVGYCASCPFVDVGQPCSSVKECKSVNLVLNDVAKKRWNKFKFY